MLTRLLRIGLKTLPLLSPAVLRKQWAHERQFRKALGLRGALRHLALRLRLKAGSSCPQFLLSSRLAPFPLWIRANTSDEKVFRQIFVRQEYAAIQADSNAVRLVIDCGANVGFSSAYFLSRFPRCSVIAVEPDSGNFAQLQKNLAPYGERVRLVQAAIWSHAADLVINDEPFRDGREWSRQVRECRPGEVADVKAIGIETLLDDSDPQTISILKIDIERAEIVVFAAGYESWLDKVEVLTIELHDEQCREIFFSAVAPYSFETVESGELTICHRTIKN